jgi:3-phenylpropionate/trans-cinnamate dioxygenase ferredoxin reductase component
MKRADVLVIGGGLAGAAAAESYRKSGGTGSITIVSEDEDLPVHRPPLSKEYLRGEKALEKVLVQPRAFYETNDIEVLLRTRVARINRTASLVELSAGDSISYGNAVLATGARPRRLDLAGSGLGGILYLRSLASSEALRVAAAQASRAVIIGAGFIGMEVAASLTQLGVKCTVVEVAPHMWANIVPSVVADYIQSVYRQRGVEFRTGVGVDSFVGESHVTGVTLNTGEVLAAELVVAGVGVILNTELAEEAGLSTARGVLVDEYLRTDDPSIYAIGDIAAFPDPIGGRMHTEHWDNALNQGRSVGKSLAGERERFDHVAYFFSDIFDLSLNMIGYPAGWEDVVVRGDPADGQFTIVYAKDGLVRAALMLNDDEHFDAWSELVRRRATADPQVLKDRSVNPLQLLPSKPPEPATS